MMIFRFLPLFAVLTLAACDRDLPQALASREALARLNALEDRTFALVKLDDSTGRMPLAGTVEDLRTLQREAKEAVMVGCAGQARDALTSAMDEMISGGTEAWLKVERYVNAVMACELVIAEEERRRSAYPG
jgi:hypothetical protein